MTLISYDFDELDTYLVGKGYVFKPGKDSKDNNIKSDCNFFYEYSYKRKNYYDFALYQCKYENYQTSINFRTPSENDYLMLKKELKAIGFKFIKTFDDNNIHFLGYLFIKTKTKYTATLASRIIYDNKPIYEITISKN